MYFADQPFHSKYHANHRDSVVALAARRGFINPGPLIAYPPNRELFLRKGGPNFLYMSRDFPLTDGDTVYLPWSERALSNLVVVFEKLIEETRKDYEDMTKGLMLNKKELEDFLTTVDILSVCAGGVAGIAGTAAAYAAELKGIESIFFRALFKLGSENKNHLLDFAIGRTLTLGGVVAVATDAPSEELEGWDWFRVVIRNTLNIPSPSYIAALLVAIGTGDAELWWKGPDHIVAARAREIAARCKSEIKDHQDAVTAAKRQLALPFYKHRI